MGNLVGLAVQDLRGSPRHDSTPRGVADTVVRKDVGRLEHGDHFAKVGIALRDSSHPETPAKQSRDRTAASTTTRTTYVHVLLQ